MSQPTRELLRLLAGIGIGIFLLIGLVVGVRLLALWRATRKLPELFLGVSLLFVGPISVALVVSSLHVLRFDPELSRRLALCAALASALGTICAALFSAVVFRPDSRAAWAAVTSLAVGLAVCLLGEWITRGFDLREPPDAFRDIRQSLAILTFLWASLESLGYWRKMRRRLAFGLAEHLVVNRFALWGIAAAAGAAAIAMGLFAHSLRHPSAGIELAGATAGLVSAVCQFLAFLPPPPYRASLLSRDS